MTQNVKGAPIANAPIFARLLLSGEVLRARTWPEKSDQQNSWKAFKIVSRTAVSTIRINIFFIPFFSIFGFFNWWIFFEYLDFWFFDFQFFYFSIDHFFLFCNFCFFIFLYYWILDFWILISVFPIWDFSIY